MNSQEICEIVDILKESLSAKDWSLVEEALMYMKDHCHDYDENEEE